MCDSPEHQRMMRRINSSLYSKAGSIDSSCLLCTTTTNSMGDDNKYDLDLSKSNNTYTAQTPSSEGYSISFVGGAFDPAPNRFYDAFESLAEYSRQNGGYAKKTSGVGDYSSE